MGRVMGESSRESWWARWQSRHAIVFVLLGVFYSLMGALFFWGAHQVLSILNWVPDFFGVVKNTPEELQQLVGMLLGTYLFTISGAFFLAVARPKQGALRVLLVMSLGFLGAGFVLLFSQEGQGYALYLLAGLFQWFIAVVVGWYSLSAPIRGKMNRNRENQLATPSTRESRPQ